MVTPYNDDFFFWWGRQIISLDDYPYVGIDFRGDLDISLPLGAAYGAIGKQYFLYISFFVFLYFKRTKIIFWMVFLNINLILVWLQTWVCNGQRDSYNIGGGIGQMRQWEERQRESFRTWRATCHV